MPAPDQQDEQTFQDYFGEASGDEGLLGSEAPISYRELRLGTHMDAGGGRLRLARRAVLAAGLIAAGALVCVLSTRSGAQQDTAPLEENILQKLEVRAPQSVYIVWTKHPNKCLDVNGGYTKNGNTMQIWDCSCPMHEDMQFLVPSETSGPVRWAKHPDKCLDAPSDPKAPTGLQWWDCASAPYQNMLFDMPRYGKGKIRLTQRPHKCMVIPDGSTENGHWLTLWNCSQESAELNMHFTIKPVPDNCRWSEWEDWGECPKTCGNATRTRKRQILQEAATCGRPCEGDEVEKGSCHPEACPLRTLENEATDGDHGGVRSSSLRSSATGQRLEQLLISSLFVVAGWSVLQ